MCERLCACGSQQCDFIERGCCDNKHFEHNKSLLSVVRSITSTLILFISTIFSTREFLPFYLWLRTLNNIRRNIFSFAIKLCFVWNCVSQMRKVRSFFFWTRCFWFCCLVFSFQNFQKILLLVACSRSTNYFDLSWV